MNHCDIIIPIKDNLSDFKPCFESIVKYTSYPYKIIMINDGSDENTTAYLKNIASKHKNTTLLNNETNLGFLKSANKGMAISNAPYLLILNTDTIVTPGWLDKMVRCAESDPSIGILNPISNKSQNLSVDIPPGENIFSFAEELDDISKKTYPDIVTAVGFCFMITRPAFNKLGFFDEIYRFGYYEESDYCMRAIKNGIRIVACDDAFVYHRDKISFVKQNYKNLKLVHANKKIFFRRWKKLYFKSLKKFNKINPLLYIRKHFYELKKFWIIRRFRYYIYKFNCFKDERGLNYAIYMTFNFLNKLRRKEIVYFYPFELSKSYQNACKKNKPRVTFIFEELNLCGGVIFLVELINNLIINGRFDIKIISFNRTKDSEDMRMYTQPVLYPNKKEMCCDQNDSDFVVATYWTTAYYVSEMIKNNLKTIPLYFIQDYESWFYPESDKKTGFKILNTYDLIKNKIVYSEWLKQKISRHSNNVIKITPGINLDIFYPRGIKSKRVKRILGMARPSTPRRGFDNMIKALKIIKEEHPYLEIAFFGPDDLKKYKIPFKYKNYGLLKEDALTKLYSSSDIFVEASLFHGLGLTGMEAMACGTACVLTDSGGPSEYAINNENAILVQPGDTQQMVNAISFLIKDDLARERLRQNGLETMNRYPIRNTAVEFEKILWSFI